MDKRKLIQKDCFASRANSTVSRYVREFRLFIQFHKKKGVSVGLPSSVVEVALYLSHLVHKNTKTSARMAYAALKWVHGILPSLHNPLDSMLCKTLIETEKRLPHSPVHKKEPVNADLIKAIFTKYAHKNSDLKNLRLATMCVLAYAGLFRSRELLDIKASHIFLAEDYLVIFVHTNQ